MVTKLTLNKTGLSVHGSETGSYRLLPHHWWFPCWHGIHTQNATLCEKTQFSFAPQRSDWTFSSRGRKSLQGTTRGQIFLFCQEPASLAFLKLRAMWRMMEGSPLQGSCCCSQWQAAQTCRVPQCWEPHASLLLCQPPPCWELRKYTEYNCRKGARRLQSWYYPRL